MNKNPKELEYLNSFEAAFKSSKIDLNVIKLFVKEENRHRLHTKPEYAANYERIFTALRNNIVVPNSLKLDFLTLFEDIAIIMKMSGVVLQPNPNTDKMTTALINSLPNNEYVWRFRILRMALALKTLNGEDFREVLIKNLFFMPSAGCFADGADVGRGAGILKHYFGTVDCLLEYAEKFIYNDEFFNRTLMEQKASLMWILEVVWNVAFKEDAGHRRVIPVWIKLFKMAIERDDRELVLYMHLPLSHIYLNLCSYQDEFKYFNDEVEMPLSEYISRNAQKWGLKPRTERKPKGSKVKLAFVTDRLVLNSPVKLLISLLTYIKDADDMELYLYDMGYIEKATSSPELIQEIKDMGITYVNNHDLIEDASLGHYYSHYGKVLKLREKIEADGIDVLVMISNRLHTNFLFSTRSAPTQLYWDHGNHEYNVKNIDKRIMHFHDITPEGFGYEIISLKLLRKYTLVDIAWSIYKASLVRDAAPPHKAAVGVIGRLMKLSDRYMETAAEILRRDTEAIFYICGTGDMGKLKAKVAELGVSDRVIFVGWADPHVYAFAFDVYLNTFPLVSGESINEFMMKNLMPDHQKYPVSIADPVNYTDDDVEAYIQRACAFLRMSKCREDLPNEDVARVFMTESFVEKNKSVADRIMKSGINCAIGDDDCIEKSFGANIIITDEPFRFKKHYGPKFIRHYYDNSCQNMSFSLEMTEIFEKYGKTILPHMGIEAAADTPLNMAKAIFDGYISAGVVEKLFTSEHIGGEYIADMVEQMAVNNELVKHIHKLKAALDYLANPKTIPTNVQATALRHVRRVLNNVYFATASEKA